MAQSRRSNYVSEPTTLDLAAVDTSKRTEGLPVENKGNRNKRVLLLDDDAELRGIIQEYLTSCSFQITAVSDGAEGLREVLKDPFDLILCDMMMPKLNGEMFYWAVIRMRPAAGQRFIFITGHQNNAIIDAFFQRINAIVLVKPFKLSALRAIVEEVLTKAC